MTKRVFGTLKNIEDYSKLTQSVANIEDRVTHHRYLDDFDERDKSVATVLSMDSAILSAIVEKYPYHFPHPIFGMNELYVSAIGSGGSDRVFETPHIDGLFAWLPRCHVLRCVVALQGNESVCTSFRFPEETYVLTTGSFLAFDYNRDIHYIWKKGSVEDTSKRVIMKLHYLVAPKGMPRLVIEWYRDIHTYYNAGLRTLFLKSQHTESLVGGAISVLINGGTKIYVAVFVGVMWLRAKLFSK
jgi:hypothetical protein